jgi:hypothetical protein
MKTIACLSILGLCLLIFAAPGSSAPGPSGPSASGDFQFSLQDGGVRYIQFDVRTQKNGETKGQMTFNDPAAEAGSDDGTGGAPTNSPAGAFVTAELDCLQIKGNAAVMSGVITESNAVNAIGSRVLLVVEDNGEGINIQSPDKLTWGVYNQPPQNWIPRDAEWDNDPGVGLTWLATDFERPDDIGIPSNQSKIIGCRTFPLSSYALVDVQHGFGNIQVRP